MNRLSSDRVKKVLEDYVKHRWSYREVAHQLGISAARAHRILSGHGYQKVPRPEGFQFPWPEHAAAQKLGHLTEAQILEAFDLYEKYLWSVRDFAQYLGITYNNARALFLGFSHKGLVRPDVPYRTRVTASDRAVREWYKKKREEDLAKVADRL